MSSCVWWEAATNKRLLLGSLGVGKLSQRFPGGGRSVKRFSRWGRLSQSLPGVEGCQKVYRG